MGSFQILTRYNLLTPTKPEGRPSRQSRPVTRPSQILDRRESHPPRRVGQETKGLTFEAVERLLHDDEREHLATLNVVEAAREAQAICRQIIRNISAALALGSGSIADETWLEATEAFEDVVPPISFIGLRLGRPDPKPGR